MQSPKPRKISLPHFLGMLQERLMFRESADRGQNAAYAVLVGAMVKSGACTFEDVIQGLKAAEEDARRVNEHAGTIRQLLNLRTRIEHLASKTEPTSKQDGES